MFVLSFFRSFCFCLSFFFVSLTFFLSLFLSFFLDFEDKVLTYNQNEFIESAIDVVR